MQDAKKIFFIGTGNMGGAILCALTEGGYPARSIFFQEPNEEQANKIANYSKAKRVLSFQDGFSEADVVFLCLKPQIFLKFSTMLRTALANCEKNPVIISIMAGVTLEALRTAFTPSKDKLHIVRTMPNIAVTAKRGAVAIATDGIENDILQTVEFMFSQCAVTYRVLENQMDAVTGLSGSGPAFVFQFIEALAMGGVKMGLSKDLAMKIALSTVFGAAEMLEESKLSPSELTANVCSPAGTTIAGIHELENRAFRGAVMAAVEASAKRSAELGNS